ncbi:MAG: histidine triad nucleotide-binding protein [Eubacteriales bacterium]
MDCIFCKIIAKEIPCDLIYEDERFIAFHDIEPQAPVHFLVVPKVHYPANGAMTQEKGELLADIFDKIPQIAKSLGVDDYRIVNNNGAQAGQTIFHLHFHVLGGRDMAWPPG